MRYTITTGGSRGDLQSSLALAEGLKAVGHEVRVATHFNYEDQVRARDLIFSSVHGDPVRDMRSLTATNQSRNVISYARQFSRNIEDSLERVLSDYRDACGDADAVIYDYAGLGGYFVAQALGLPSIGAFAEPLFAPTANFRSPLMPQAPAAIRGTALHKRYNYLSHLAAGQIFWQPIRPMLNEALTRVLKVDPVPIRGPFKQLRHSGQKNLFGFSPSVLPPPEEWNEDWLVTGYWFLETEPSWQPPDELSDFLRAGPPPLCITLGSVIEDEPQIMTELLLESLRSNGQRAIIQRGWSGLGSTTLPDNVIQVGDLPHEWLFPHVSAVVHHGGDGTAAAALRAGVPSVVIPSSHTQPFWASKLRTLGAATEPIPRSQLTTARLSTAIHDVVNDNSMSDAAKSIAAKISQENGIQRAVEAIEAYTQFQPTQLHNAH